MPTLMLLPGLMCDAGVWAPQCAALQVQAHCVVPTYGLRDSLGAMAQHALDQAPTDRFSLAGHSLGARVALEVLRLAPQRVARLALLDAGVYPLPAGDEGERERCGRMALLELARHQGMRVVGRQWARGMVHPDQLDTPLFEALLDMFARSSPAQFGAQIKALLSRPDASALLPGISCPTLVLCGREDSWSTPAQHERIWDAIAGAELCIIERCGHMSTLEQPQAVNAALASWLRR